MKEGKIFAKSSNIFCDFKRYKYMYHTANKCNYDGFIVTAFTSFRFTL